MKRLALILLLFPILLFGQYLPITKTGNFIDIPEGTYTDIKDSIDYVGSITYFNPDGSNGDGSYASPINTLSGFTFNNNECILQLRGTSWTTDIYISADNFLYGDYGISTSTAEVNKLQVQGDDCTVRDIEFNTYCDLGNSTYPITGVTLYHTTHNGIPPSSAITGGLESGRIIGVYISEAETDGMFIRNRGTYIGSNLEISYCNITNCNQKWFDDTDPIVSDGDGIQIQKYDTAWVHNNIFDRSPTGNKFCLIIGDVGTKESVQLYTIVEYNEFIGPLNSSSGVIYFADNLRAIIRNNSVTQPNSNSYAISFYNNEIGTTLNGEIYGNIVYNCAYDVKAWSADGNIDLDIYNNTFVTSTSLASDLNDKNFYLRNNIFPFNTSGLHSSNIFIDTEGSTNLFTDAANDDYTLKAASPAIDNGVWDGLYMSSYDNDLYGVVVPNNSIDLDIGGSQYSSGVVYHCDTINITTSAVIVNDENNTGIGSIDLTVSGNGNSPYTYDWSNDSTTEDISGLFASTYTIIVTDDDGCLGEDSYNVNNTWTDLPNQIIIDTVYAEDEALPDGLAVYSIDSTLLTSWGSQVYGVNIVFVLSDTSDVDSFGIGAYKDDERSLYGSAQGSLDSLNWGVVVPCTTQIGGDAIEYFDASFSKVKYVRFTGYANSSGNGWTTVSDFAVFGADYTPAPSSSNEWYDSLSYWWTFNNTYVDTFGLNNATNVATSFTTDKDGNTNFAVNTTSSYMTIDDLNFGATDEWTMMWLMYPTSTYREMFRYDASNEILYGDNKLRIDNTGTYQEFDYTFSPSTWYHVALVAQSSNYIRLFVDSVLVDSVLLTDNALQIDEISSSGTGWSGYYDEIMVAYNAFPLEGIKEAMKKFPIPSNPCDTVTMIISGIIDTVYCYGGSQGSKITTSTLGGATPLTYLWSTGETVDSIYNKTAGEYSVTVTDVNGCDTSKSFNIPQPELLSQGGVYNRQTVTCYNGSDGSITLTPSGGTSPYTVYWSTLGLYANQVDTLSPGNTSVTVVDNNGCTISTQYVIYNAPIIIDNYNSSSQNYDNKTGTGSILIAPTGGIGGLSYEWNNSYTEKDRYNLRPGGYTISITDANGCVQNYEYIIKYVYSPYNKTKAKITGKKALIKDGKIKR